MPKKPFSRLPTDVVPKRYNLHLTPNFETFKFKGNVEIEVDVVESTSTISMNAVELDIESVSVNGKSAAVTVDAETETLTLTLKKPAKKGKGSIVIDYYGYHNDALEGFYRTKCQDGYAVITQFEPTSARRSVPCWDEPKCKAKYNVKLTVPTGKVALSNVDVKKEVKNKNATTTYTYNETPIMSSYLLAFFVGEFDFIEGATNKGVKVRCYTESGNTHQAKFALDVAIKSLEFFEEYFGISYPLPKCDMVAVPDFSAGAMENWGLITYRSSSILFDEEKSTLSTKVNIAITVSHELAHQWFGNLVTMEWWTHLWLNEGFATFMEHLCIDNIFPHWHTFEQFVSQEMFGAMGLDSLDTSHPIEVEVGHPSEVGEIFDAISYRKGASIIRMLYNWIGDKSFRSGMHAYLSKHAYSNASTTNLWDELEKASGLPVADVMSDWTQRMGFPLVSVNVAERTDDSLTLNLKQWKFSFSGEAMSADGNEPWKIPIVYETSNGEIGNVLFRDREMQVVIPNIKKDGWVKLNKNVTGFYHVRYSDELLKPLMKNIPNFSNTDRLEIVADIVACCRAGYMDTSEFFSLLSCYRNETDFNVWQKISTGLAKYRQLADELGCRQEFNALVIDMMLPTAKNIGFEAQDSDTHTTPMLRTLLWGMLGSAECDDMINYSMKQFKVLMANPNENDVPADMKSIILATVTRNSGDLASLIKLHGMVTMTEEKNTVERNFGHLKSRTDLEKGIDYLFTDAVRKQDLPHALSGIVIGSKTGRDAIWKRITNDTEFFKSAFSSPFMLGGLMKHVVSQFSTKAQIDAAEQFFQENAFEAATRSIQQGLETARLTSQWLVRDGEDIKRCIGNYKLMTELKRHYD